MLSILIPTYNTPIKELVLTTLEQARAANIVFEIIFCEDASVSFVSENLLLSQNKEIIQINNKINLGRTATRSLLAETAKYNWLLFLDADIVIKKENFISEYLKHLNGPHSIVSGGNSYYTSTPNGKELRWKYGTHREAKSAIQRVANKYFIISQNILINRDTFLDLNLVRSRKYGLDNIFSYQIFKQRITVHHIDNPILHIGLEENEIFLKKSIEAVDTLVYFEKTGVMGLNFTSLQKAYVKLKKTKATRLYYYVLTPFLKVIYKNLTSRKPSLFLFDLYRLYHYANSKNHA